MSTGSIAFFIGLFGSIHCIGMCGPLAFSVPSFHSKWWLILTDKFVYNIGRVITYSLLGLLIGFVGEKLWISGLQQGVSLLSGLLVIIAGLSRLLKIKLSQNPVVSQVISPVNTLLRYALNHRAGHLVVGMLNGLLPCGFVYLALIGALNTSSPLASARFMFYFGLGTFPLMLLATVSAGFIGPIFRRRINLVMPYLIICLGIWFIFRGMGLNIPYLSPAKQTNGVAICH